MDCAAFGATVWAMAQTLVGVRFRLHGRDAATGLDCVGLVGAAYQRAGHDFAGVPDSYRLRGQGAHNAEQWLAAAGLCRAVDAMAGDVLLADMGLGQLHLLIGGQQAVVHAHAGLRRVVMMPGDGGGQIISRWRLQHEISI